MRRISWIKAARKAFERFPTTVRERMLRALELAAAGAKADIAKPLKGFESGVFEIALRHGGDAYRLVYAVRIGEDIWVLHAFQKKSKRGITTPKEDIELVNQRLKQLKGQFQ